MSTVTHLEQFRGLKAWELPQRRHNESLDEQARFRELWSDALATVAVVTLASMVIFETLRVLLW